MRLIVNGTPYQVDVEAGMPLVGSLGCAGPDRHEIWMRCLHLRGLEKGGETSARRTPGLPCAAPGTKQQERGPQHRRITPPMRLVVNGSPYQIDVEADMLLVGSHGCAGPDGREI